LRSSTQVPAWLPLLSVGSLLGHSAWTVRWKGWFGNPEMGSKHLRRQCSNLVNTCSGSCCCCCCFHHASLAIPTQARAHNCQTMCTLLPDTDSSSELPTQLTRCCCPESSLPGLVPCTYCLHQPPHSALWFSQTLTSTRTWLNMKPNQHPSPVQSSST
jgi:hypothetical protein